MYLLLLLLLFVVCCCLLLLCCCFLLFVVVIIVTVVVVVVVCCCLVVVMFCFVFFSLNIASFACSPALAFLRWFIHVCVVLSFILRDPFLVCCLLKFFFAES